MVIHWIVGIPCVIYYVVSLCFFEPQMLKPLYGVYIYGVSFCRYCNYRVGLCVDFLCGVFLYGIPLYGTYIQTLWVVHLWETLYVLNSPYKFCILPTLTDKSSITLP